MCFWFIACFVLTCFSQYYVDSTVNGTTTIYYDDTATTSTSYFNDPGDENTQIYMSLRNIDSLDSETLIVDFTDYPYDSAHYYNLYCSFSGTPPNLKTCSQVLFSYSSTSTTISSDDLTVKLVDNIYKVYASTCEPGTQLSHKLYFNKDESTDYTMNQENIPQLVPIPELPETPMDETNLNAPLFKVQPLDTEGDFDLTGIIKKSVDFGYCNKHEVKEDLSRILRRVSDGCFCVKIPVGESVHHFYKKGKSKTKEYLSHIITTKNNTFLLCDLLNDRQFLDSITDKSIKPNSTEKTCFITNKLFPYVEDLNYYEALITPFFSHLKQFTCNNEDKVFEYLLNWVAFLIQNPLKKIKTTIILNGINEDKKKYFTETVCKLLGKLSNSNCDSVSSFKKECRQNVFNWQTHSLFVIKTNTLQSSVLNQLEKYVINEQDEDDELYSNGVNFIIDCKKFLSTHDISFPCLFLNTDDSPDNNLDHCSELLKYSQSEKFYNFLYTFFKNRPIPLAFINTDVDSLGSSPKNFNKKHIQYIDLFVTEFIKNFTWPVNDKGENMCPAHDMFDYYVAHCKEIGKNPLNRNHFYKVAQVNVTPIKKNVKRSGENKRTTNVFYKQIEEKKPKKTN
ncbi:virulence-associated protein E family [Entamoeba marina]